MAVHKKTYTYCYHRKGCGVPCYARKTVYPNKTRKNNNSGFDFFVDSVAYLIAGSSGNKRYR